MFGSAAQLTNGSCTAVASSDGYASGMNVFGKSQTSLPLHGGSRSNGISIPTVNTNVLLTLFWIIASIVTVYLGNLHCRNYSINSTVICDSSSCQVNQRLPKGKITSYSFNSQDLIDSEMVRVNNGDVVTTTGVSRKVSMSYGYSVQIKFKSLVEEGSRIKVQTTVLLSPYDTGRRSARGTVSKIDRFIEGKTKELNLTVGESWTWVGILVIIGGLVSLVCSFIYGQFSDPAPRRMRKSK